MVGPSIILWSDARGAAVLDQHAELYQALQLLGDFTRRVVVNALGRFRLVECTVLFQRPQENCETQAATEEQFADDLDRRSHYRAHQRLATSH